MFGRIQQTMAQYSIQLEALLILFDDVNSLKTFFNVVACQSLKNSHFLTRNENLNDNTCSDYDDNEFKNN